MNNLMTGDGGGYAHDLIKCVVLEINCFGWRTPKNRIPMMVELSKRDDHIYEFRRMPNVWR